MLTLAKSLLVLAGASAYAAPSKRAITPKLAKDPELLATAIDPNLQRDSCVTTYELVDGRPFWLCRDSIVLKNQSIHDEIYQGLFQGGAAGFVASTAAWSDVDSNGPVLVPIPANQGSTEITDNYSKQLTQYGGESIYNQNKPYVYYQPNECDGIPAGSSQGNCNDGTRYALWPTTPAVVTSTASDGTITMYHYIRVAYIYSFLGIVDFYPPASLYKLTYKPNGDSHAVPAIDLVDQYFFPRFAYNYGDFALTKDKTGQTLYLYGASLQNNVGLARVSINSVEDKSAYEYYYANGTWSDIQPNVNQTDAFVSVPDFGQGSLFYSDYFGSYVWFAQLANPGGYPELWVSTAPNPEGPWSARELVYGFPKGPTFSYTLAMHPAMSVVDNELYFSYTYQVYYPGLTNATIYDLPFYKLTFQ